jgi:hypothetical protein
MPVLLLRFSVKEAWVFEKVGTLGGVESLGGIVCISRP